MHFQIMNTFTKFIFILFHTSLISSDFVKSFNPSSKENSQQYWQHVLPKPDSIFLNPTTPMNLIKTFARRSTKFETIDRINGGDKFQLGNGVDYSNHDTTTPLIITSHNEDDLEEDSYDNRQVSMKITVLEAEIPSKIISYPNVHNIDIANESEDSVDRQPLIKSTSNQMIVSDDIITEIKYENHTYFPPVVHKTLIADVNVLSKSKRKEKAIIDEVLPKAEKLQQHNYNFPEYDYVQHYEPSDLSWDLDAKFVCQIHRCDDFRGNRNEQNIPEKFRKQKPNLYSEIDFNVGTDILKDIWNNHINSQHEMALEIVDVRLDTPIVRNKPQTNQKSLFRLGLGSKFDPQMKPPPINQPKGPFNPHSPYPELLYPSHLNSPFFSNKFTNLFPKIGEAAESSENEESGPVPLPTGYRNPNANNDKHFWLNQQTKLNFPIETESTQVQPQNEINFSQDNVFPNVDTLSTKIGVSDDFSNPVSHLLPPSVLPSIHEDAKEGRIVQTGESTRIVLRLKPSSNHPNGEVLSLPASKFNQFGTADLTLDNGQKVSVRIKHVSKNNNPNHSPLPESTHFSNFIETDDSNLRDDHEEDFGEIPITILRDGKTGIPIMAIPGLKPSQDTILNQDKQKQLPPLTLPNVPLQPSSNFGPSQPVLTNTNGGFSSSLSNNVDVIREQIRQGFRGFMSQFEAIPNSMESDIFDSFDSSVRFLRRFYGNALPQSYFDDSMTVVSIAAFMAFLGARVSDISTTLTAAGIGRRALTELENVMGRENSNKITDILNTIDNKFNNKKEQEKSYHREYLFNDDINSNFVEDEKEDYSIYKDLESLAKLVDDYVSPMIESGNQSLSLPCLQKQMCLLTSAGVDKGGLSALIAPIVSTSVASYLVSKPLTDPLSLLSALRPLWMAKTNSDERVTDTGACDNLACELRVSHVM